MSSTFSYRHLYYFWVVAKEGGMSRAAERLGMAVQTVSAQVRELERDLGHVLLRPQGRGLALTEAGQEAYRQAEQIFQLGERLPGLVREAASTPAVRLAVGISNGLPKLAVRLLLMPALEAEPQLRLLCHEDRFDDLLGELALHRLDVVLADRPAPANPNLRLYSHKLGSSLLAWYGPPELAERARDGFPAALAGVPVLLPTQHAGVRAALDQWLERHGLRPRIAGEFEDAALLATFGASGLGVFTAPQLVQDKLMQRYGLQPIGPCEGVEEHFYAIDTARRVAHPLVRRLLETPRH